MNLLRTPNALNLQDFLEHFELTLLCILHPRYNSIPAENRMGDTLSLKITDKVLYIQHLDRSRYDSTDLFRFNKSLKVLFMSSYIYQQLIFLAIHIQLVFVLNIKEQ